MKASHGVPMVLGFILAFSLFAVSALGAPAQDTGYRPAHHRPADFAKARALVSPSPVLVPEAILPAGQENHGRLTTAAKTDGLSRADDDCNFGCIDH